ncbi:MAG: type II toxin-antitoxin system Phd/YefM family antitoxin [Bacteroidota bacterium]|nr:type II toxin-antitoxin system Phd/YefM family antitoxin [Bacteroidota bacterium]MDP4232235.1 type II toxin-antitoxin system Phd/YefM family antitoxin [Bacteroidota bacterium]MDP4243585.1 type II toxin-antitoxin system Phd/YefM family antitoxin [Bacteroidota bacterium]MDP4289120.1 type II toxin-antitoxin system Phd/YefM family antitoxin [Bacteroidota bacterium]
MVVLPKDEFLSLQEKAEDYEDLLDLEEAIRKNADDPGVSYEEFRKTLGL